jgi:hypothetical protein
MDGLIFILSCIVRHLNTRTITSVPTFAAVLSRKRSQIRVKELDFMYETEIHVFNLNNTYWDMYTH